MTLPLTFCRPLTRALSALATTLAALPALAHDGHGLPGTVHWHASDAFGFGLALAVAALAWLIGRGR
jgi:predicted Kef-type K+ transport protein